MRRLLLTLPAALVLAAVLATTAGGAGHRSLQLRKTSLGRVIVDGQGRTLYRFLHDHGKKSTCSGACAAAWPPATAKGKATVGKGLSKRFVGKTRRRDGTTQWTYRGHPLYRFAGDTAAGAVKGQGIAAFGGKWFVVDANGRVVTKAATASAPAAPAPTMSGSGY